MTDNEIIKACGEMCTDNRFELIKKYKELLIEGTNIETSADEMAVIDNILFRFWQMGWLNKLEESARLKQELDRLKNYNENLLAANVGLSCGMLDEIKTAKSEAIKEFAERLKEQAYYPYRNSVWMIVTTDDIDNLVKEMTEGV